MLKRLLNKAKPSPANYATVPILVKGKARRNIRGHDSDNGGPSSADPQQQRTVYPDLDANWINLDTIRAWADHECTEYPKFGSPPTWLIDVRQECLVSPAQLPGEAKYCALSYVWGQAETGKLTTATRRAFCQPGAFSANSPTPVVIPKTIRHAIGLVRELGEQYLWVDSLCIIQDQDMGHELANMGAIYDRATLTIIAATAWDANDGLWGLRGISRPRHLSAFGDDMHKYLDPESMIWNSRAWTFQEGQFSRRMIMFCDQTVIWKCLCCCKDEVGRNLAAQGSLAHVNLLARGKANRGQHLDVLFAEYCETLVSPYNTRNCTRTADLPRAFEGIAHALAETADPRTLFFQGFCWGLPVAFLPHALTWCAGEENLRPRHQVLGFPSWSWFAWEGNITLERLPHGSWEIRNFLLDTRPLCDWDIVELMPRQGTVRAPGDSQRIAMKIKGEFCHFEAAKLQWTYHTAKAAGQIGYCSVIYEPDMANILSSCLIALYPDQANEWTKLSTSDVYLVGVSTLYPQYLVSKTARDESFVKAIWVARSDEDPVLENASVSSFRRLGVAIVNIVDWARGLQGEGVPVKEVLLE